jgi:hypothetical protein
MHMTVTECGQILWLIYWANTTEILGVHILGLHAADLIHEASNAIAMGIFIKVCTCPLLSHFYMKRMGRTNTISNIFKYIFQRLLIVMLLFVKLGELLVITFGEVMTLNSLVVNVWLYPITQKFVGRWSICCGQFLSLLCATNAFGNSIAVH